MRDSLIFLPGLTEKAPAGQNLRGLYQEGDRGTYEHTMSQSETGSIECIGGVDKGKRELPQWEEGGNLPYSQPWSAYSGRNSSSNGVGAPIKQK